MRGRPTIRSRGWPTASHAGDRNLVLAQPEPRIPGEDAHPELVEVDVELIAHELPRVLDGAFLEVLADGEVAHHLEEREVVAVETDLVDVGRPEDFLVGGQQRRRRLFLSPRK